MPIFQFISIVEDLDMFEVIEFLLLVEDNFKTRHISCCVEVEFMVVINQ